MSDQTAQKFSRKTGRTRGRDPAFGGNYPSSCACMNTHRRRPSPFQRLECQVISPKQSTSPLVEIAEMFRFAAPRSVKVLSAPKADAAIMDRPFCTKHPVRL